MSTTYILGAGASHSYDMSPSGVLPPLSRGFFRAYYDLDISGDVEVRVGNIVTYVRDEYGVPMEAFDTFNEDAERFMTRLDQYVRDQADLIQTATPEIEEFGVLVDRIRAHDQMIFLFAHVLNEIQNGPVSPDYEVLASKASDSDTFVTFNWDTLLDRALATCTNWSPDLGYGVPFRAVLDGPWRPVDSEHTGNCPAYFKLHGSTNWLVNYMTWHLQSGERVMLSPRGQVQGRTTIASDMRFLESILDGRLLPPEIREVDWAFSAPPKPEDPEANPFLILRANEPYRAYKNRYRRGYVPFTYFFPPNDPETDTSLMPLIIPPTEYKLYEEYAHIIDPLWDGALEACSSSEQVVILGYSLPATDHRASMLIRGALDGGCRKFVVANPHPQAVVDRLEDQASIPRDFVVPNAATFREFVESM